MLIMHDVCKAFDGKHVIEGFSREFMDATATALMGPSGCGKTTLLGIALGLLTPDSGEARATGVISAVFQEDRLIDGRSALANVRLVCGRDVHGDQILALLSELGLADDCGKRVSAFSGGMKRRVAIARALIVSPDLLVLDEPFKGLDDASRQSAAACIKRRCPKATILMATHDAQDAKLLGADILRLLPASASARA